MPILSMTGFGVADRAWPERGLRVHIELRSVNARFLELKLRQPFGVAVEHRLRRLLEAHLGRGRVELGLRVEGAGALADDPLGAIGIDRERLDQVLRALGSLVDEAYRASFQVSHPTSLELLRFLVTNSSERGVGKGPGESHDAPPFLDELVGDAVAKLVEMRVAEGVSLAEDLSRALAELEAAVARISASLEDEGPRLHEGLVTRAEALLARVDGGALDPQRLEQELALLLARGDVSEELARIASHVAQARSVLAATPEPGQGKTLDFISQELHREVTTIGSKITSHAGSTVVIEAKRSIERIREQVQNVE